VTHVKRKALSLIFILTLLFSGIAGAQLSPLTKANIMIGYMPPRINMLSPINGTYNTNNLSLSVNFTAYATGLYDGGPRYENTRMFTYTLDEKEPHNITITQNYIRSAPGATIFFEGEESLNDLTEGLHNLTVRGVFIYSRFPSDLYNITAESESTVFFRIDFVPQNVSILMPENSTYAPYGVPLQFFIDEPPSWTGYSLDGQENVTVTGNVTLPELAIGQHTLTFYANDTAGNPAASETITFSVEPFPTTLIIATVMIVAVAGIGLIIYFKKRKR
jgi:hypothetical protein